MEREGDSIIPYNNSIVLMWKFMQLTLLLICILSYHHNKINTGVIYHSLAQTLT